MSEAAWKARAGVAGAVGARLAKVTAELSDMKENLEYWETFAAMANDRAEAAETKLATTKSEKNRNFRAWKKTEALLAEVTAERDENLRCALMRRERLDDLESRIAKLCEEAAHNKDVYDKSAEVAEAHKRAYKARAEAAEAANQIWRENSRQTFDAMVAMRNSINEYIPMPSLESDLLQGPENSVFCAAVAEAVIAFIAKEKETCRSTHETVIGATTTGPHGSDANAQDAEDRAANLRFYRAGIEAAARVAEKGWFGDGTLRHRLGKARAIRVLPDPTPEQMDAIRKGGEL